MNLQPTLKSDLILLRPLLETDLVGLLEAASDPLIWKMHPQPDRYKPEVFKLFFKEALESHGALLIIDIKTSEIIGTSRFYDFDAKNQSIKIGYTFLARKYWGGTYNQDLKKLMVNYVLQFAKSALFEVGFNNLIAQKSMIKIGAVNTGIQEVKISYGPPKKSFIYMINKSLF